MERSSRISSSSRTRVAQACTLALLAGAPAMWAEDIPLAGGVDTIDLTAGVTQPVFTFVNNTGVRICDLKLSTNDSDGIDPDFQGGPVIVRQPPDGPNQNWTNNPANGDGVEDMKVAAPGIPEDTTRCIEPGGRFSVGMTFDGVGSGDILRVSPTNLDGHEIQNSTTGLRTTNSYGLFNGYDNIDPSPSGIVVTVNATGGDITHLLFGTSPSFANVIEVTSSLGGTYSQGSQMFFFDFPVPRCGEVDFTFFIDQLAPFVSGDPDPFTYVLVQAQGPSPCPTDFDGNGQTDLGDLALLLSNFGFPASPCQGDLDGDGLVTLGDLTIMLSHFGETCG